MNYIKEMNAFIDWLETNPLEATTQTLWFHLMAIANKSGWPEWFAVANPLLQAKVGISENSLNKHRNILEQKGRIEYRNQGKKKPGKYRIIPFASNIEVIHEVNREVNCSALNNKLNKTKRDIYTPDFEQFWEVYPRKVGKQRAFTCWKARIKEESPETLILCAKNYADVCKAKGTAIEYIKHPSTFLSAKKDYEDYLSPLKTEYTQKNPEPSRGPRLELVQTTDEEAKWLEEMARRQRERNQAANGP